MLCLALAPPLALLFYHLDLFHQVSRPNIADVLVRLCQVRRLFEPVAKDGAGGKVCEGAV